MRMIQFDLAYWFDRFIKKNRFVHEPAMSMITSLQRDGGGKRKGEDWGVEAPQIHK